MRGEQNWMNEWRLTGFSIITSYTREGIIFGLGAGKKEEEMGNENETK